MNVVVDILSTGLCAFYDCIRWIPQEGEREGTGNIKVTCRYSIPHDP